MAIAINDFKRLVHCVPPAECSRGAFEIDSSTSIAKEIAARASTLHALEFSSSTQL